MSVNSLSPLTEARAHQLKPEAAIDHLLEARGCGGTYPEDGRAL